MPRKTRAGKGSFSDVELPVAGRYPRGDGRRRPLLVAAAVVGLAALVVVFLFLRHGRLLAAGPLSSHHADLERDCAACHTGFAAVGNDACSTCHERFGDQLGTYTFASHYLYRSNDFQRLVPSPDEVPCAACHGEHGGREAAITRVPDARCTTCHEIGSFSRGHPQFDFAAEGLADDGALAFTHVHHTREVMKRGGLADVEEACLACHEPRPDGRSFRPISFDRHCDDCHLTATDRTRPLPVAGDGGTDGTPGVETLEAIQRRGGPGTRWAYFLSSAEFRRLGDRVVKSPLYHRDPWVLENLRRLRRTLYPQAGLADLLTASPDVDPAELPALYAEAIATLEDHALGLRSRPEPEIQAELAKIDELLADLERRLEDPYAPLDETRFLLAPGPVDPDLSAEEVAAVESVVADLTEACRRCHAVTQATIARVAADQRTLGRAEFNHRVHVLQRRCLDCHTEIPVAELLGGEGEVDPRIDRAEIQNLPAIDTCRGCHNPQVAADRCVTCHLFHPDRARRAQLQLAGEGP